MIFSTNTLDPIEFFSLLIICPYHWLVIFFKVRLFLLDKFLVNGRVGRVRISFPLSSVLGSWSWDVDKEEGGAIFGCQEKGTRCCVPGGWMMILLTLMLVHSTLCSTLMIRSIIFSAFWGHCCLASDRVFYMDPKMTDHCSSSPRARVWITCHV